MGFATGFTGGVTLTLSVTYLSLLAHQRNRDAQSRSLRAQALALHSLVDPLPPPPPPTRSQVAAAQRDASVEVAKQRWNAEVENAVRWVQRTDWGGVREGLEERAGYLWATATGRPWEEVDRARRGALVLEPAAVREPRAGVVEQATELAETIELSAENRALDARLRSKRLVDETKASVQGAVGAALDRSRETAKAAVDLAAAQVEDMTGGKVSPPTPTPTPPIKSSPVQQALRQRYEKPAREKRTVAEVLKERYTPFDQRDNSVLRGL